MDAVQMRAAVASWGRDFDGSEWLLLMETATPIDEVVLVLAVTEPTMRLSADPHPTGLRVGYRECEGTLVVEVEVVLMDIPERPLRICALVNPGAAEGHDLLARLAAQDTVQLIFCDRDDATPLGRRLMALDTSLRAALQTVLASARGAGPPTTQQWDRAVDSVRQAG